MDLNEVIQSVIELLSRENAEIHFTAAKKCIHLIRVDALKRILINLIENALIYSDGLPVNVTCKCNSQAGTTISVADQGPGIRGDRPPGCHD